MGLAKQASAIDTPNGTTLSRVALTGPAGYPKELADGTTIHMVKFGRRGETE